ncbi:Mrp/NBP35 family ATP-binding protein [Rhodospirillaceae bacterium AH-315-P19]|nr:Mrp/NBP35 family ATP-binding protein [Rhodospirillaceae bacterium AH-315-P19]
MEQPFPLPGIRAVLAVSSAKGGVGKSTTAVNLAVGMAQRGKRVAMLDADVYGPSLPRLLGIQGTPTLLDDKRLVPMQAYGIGCMSIGFLVEEATPMIWRGAMVMGAIENLIKDVAWGDLDVLVLDFPPGTGDAQLSIMQRIPLTGAVIVSTPQDIALLDTRKGIAMFQKMNVPILGLVENMSYFTCPNCDGRSDIFGHGGAHMAAKELGIDFLGEVPLDLEIRETSDAGTPIVMAAPDSAVATTYFRIVDQLLEKIDATARKPTHPAPKIVIE